MPPGLMFGPDLPPPKLKEPKSKKKTMSKKAIERRMKKRQERQIEEAARLEQQQKRRDAKIAAKREEEMKRRAEGVMKVKAKRGPMCHHGSEQVDAIILKVLGKSSKSQRGAGKGQQSVAGKKKVGTQQEANWKPGMREVAGERMQRMQKLRQRRRLMKKAEAVRISKKEAKVAGERRQRMQKLRQRRRLMKKAEAARISEKEAKVLIGNIPFNPPSPTIHPEVKPLTVHPEIKFPKPPSISIPSDVELTESSGREGELSSDNQEGKHSAKKKKYVKRHSEKTNPSPESSDEEEEEKPIPQRRRKGFLRQVNPAPDLTESSGAETPYMADDEEQIRATHVYGELKGGGGPYEEDLSPAELMRMAIQEAQLQLKLDADTPGLGNCFSIAMVQQFQRPQVKLFLQSRGMKITSFMQLKKKVVEFVSTHMDTEKMRDLKENFEASQRNMAMENPHLKPRTWSKYWKDMLKDGEWADDTFIQACCWFLNMHIVIVSAGRVTSDKPFYAMQGTFSSETTGPTLLVGYINGNHYQSLLPLQEDRSRPEYLAQPAIDKTLHDVLKTLGFGSTNSTQRSQVSS